MAGDGSTTNPRPESRTPEELWHELRARGHVSLEAANPGSRLAVILGLVTAALLALLGVAALVLGVPLVGFGLLAFACIGAVVAAVARAKDRSARGVPWLIDRRGITVNGIGPIPWTDLEPPTRRMVPARFDESRESALVMPLNDVGKHRALALPPDARKAIDPALQRTVIGGEPQLTMIRIPALKSMSGDEFARFLGGALELARRGH